MLTAQGELWLNSPDSILRGVECERCGNRGYLLHVGAHKELLTEECTCMEQRRKLRMERLRGMQR